MSPIIPGRTVAQKMGVRPGCRAFLSNIPPEIRKVLILPALNLSPQLTGNFDYLHLFVTTQVDLDAAFPRFRDQLRPRGALWVSWPKGGQLGTDLSLRHVIRIGCRHGLSESTCLSLDDIWSALKFSWPKPGKVYRNGHATLARHAR